MRRTLGCALGLTLCATLPAFGQAIDPLERAWPAVVKVYGAGGFQGVPAYGSGVIVDARGFVLTAWSIALRTPSLRAVDVDGRSYPAVIWRADPGLGVALLKLELPVGGLGAAKVELRPLALGRSEAVSPGDTIYTLGNPFGFVYGAERVAVQRGVVTTVGAPQEDARVLNLPERLPRLILHDAPHNPGTQGGPLLTRSGELVGICGRIVESRATNTLLNFAVPTELLRDFVREAITWRSPNPDPPRPPAESAAGPPVTGLRLLRAHLVRSPLAYVERVVPESPAARAGFEPDDLVFRLAGRTIRSCRDYDQVLESLAAGQEVEVVVKRGPALITLRLRLEAP
ncbi:MAG: trypsin-like peptidase domain-containing protein [Planctomycetes bacterium]|nr:trypsin-like peptidase domain-containing protein [Planctomycetota bacterium]